MIRGYKISAISTLRIPATEEEVVLKIVEWLVPRRRKTPIS
jgi:hypothetical protein